MTGQTVGGDGNCVGILISSLSAAAEEKTCTMDLYTGFYTGG